MPKLPTTYDLLALRLDPARVSLERSGFQIPRLPLDPEGLTIQSLLHTQQLAEWAVKHGLFILQEQMANCPECQGGGLEEGPNPCRKCIQVRKALAAFPETYK